MCEKKTATGLERRCCALPDSTVRMFGIARDIPECKLADDQQELARRELEHRMQNSFAVLTSIVAHSERFACTPAQLAHSLLWENWDAR